MSTGFGTKRRMGHMSASLCGWMMIRYVLHSPLSMLIGLKNLH
jgi:hypothetical protein